MPQNPFTWTLTCVHAVRYLGWVFTNRTVFLGTAQVFYPRKHVLNDTGLISWRYSFDSSRRFRRDRIQVYGQREPRRRGVANFYFNFQVWDMIGFVPCKKNQRDLLLRFEEEGGKCEPAGYLSLHPLFLNWKMFSFSFFLFCCHHMPH